MTRPKPHIIGHRGASFDAPENTLAAFRLAWEHGADGCELDVHATKDGQIVAIHDADLRRTAGIDRRVADVTLAELQALDVGRWKADTFAGERVPTLTEVLATMPQGGYLLIEVKCGAAHVPELVAVLSASGLPADRTVVIAFDAEVIMAVKLALPGVVAYWVVDLDERPAPPLALADLAKATGADGLDLSASSDRLDTGMAAAVRGAGLRLYVWTVNDPAVARRMIDLGVDGITTDRPGWLREQLGL
jgi:glycerophosphoryl diester phosphodiesterase